MSDEEIVRKTWGYVMLDNAEAVEYIRAEAGPALGRLTAERDELRQDVLGAKTDARAWKDSCKEAEAAVRLLREALTDFADHGTRFDCNPTVMVYNTPEWVASQEWWQNRATQMDVAVRNRARAALAREDA